MEDLSDLGTNLLLPAPLTGRQGFDKQRETRLNISLLKISNTATLSERVVANFIAEDRVFKFM